MRRARTRLQRRVRNAHAHVVNSMWDVHCESTGGRDACIHKMHTRMHAYIVMHAYTLDAGARAPARGGL